MEKKVLLKDLVDTGTNLRKQITSKVRVSDQGVYPIGEIWDANTVVDVIVNGSHEQHDTVRELDEFAHDIDNRLVSEVARAKAAEQELDRIKANKATTLAGYGITDAYTKNQINDIIGDLGQIPDQYATYSFDLYDSEGETKYSSGKATLTPVETDDYYQIVITENTPVNDWQDELVGKKFFMSKDAVMDGQTLVQLYKQDMSSAGIALKMMQLSPTTYKNPTIKEYIDYSILKHISGEGYIVIIPPNSVDTESIIDGSIQIQDLSDDLKDKLQPTVDEDDENVFIG